jgi:hypothetical protein
VPAKVLAWLITLEILFEETVEVELPTTIVSVVFLEEPQELKNTESRTSRQTLFMA